MDNPIEHVVIIFKENHTVDNYFGQFPGVDGNIATYWAYAQQFTLSDRYFSDVASQSEPNHLLAIAADSPVIDNSGVHRSYQPHPPYDMPSLPATLESAGRTWRGYADPLTSFLANIADLRTSAEIVPANQFDTDLASDSFPAVSWLYPPEGLSEHPGDWHEGPVLAPGVAWTAAHASQVKFCIRLFGLQPWDVPALAADDPPGLASDTAR